MICRIPALRLRVDLPANLQHGRVDAQFRHDVVQLGGRRVYVAEAKPAFGSLKYMQSGGWSGFMRFGISVGPGVCHADARLSNAYASIRNGDLLRHTYSKRNIASKKTRRISASRFIWDRIHETTRI